MGRFKLGSTVVLTFAADAVEFLPNNYPGSVTRMEVLLLKKYLAKRTNFPRNVVVKEMTC